MALEAIHTLLAAELAAVDGLITQQLSSDIMLINEIGRHIIHSGGKRLRPIMVLLGALAFDYQGSHHLTLAAMIELIHTATLLHDDVVDTSQLRRGKATANAAWGNPAAVLVGDFLYSRSFQMMVETNNLQVLATLAKATNTIAEGEVLQLLNCHDPETTEDRYMEVIRYKTGTLFEAAAQLGPILTQQSAATITQFGEYGLALGTAFQLMDDVLDYQASATDLGKNVGDDLAEGKPTLPLIYAMRQGSPMQVEQIRQAIEQGNRADLANILATIHATQAIDYTLKVAQRYAEQAIASIANLSASPYQAALVDLAEFAIKRSF